MAATCPLFAHHEEHMNMSMAKDTTQALCRPWMTIKAKFTITNVGCTSRVHDIAVLRPPGIYLFEQKGTLFSPNDMLINSVLVPTVILGNPTTALVHEALVWYQRTWQKV